MLYLTAAAVKQLQVATQARATLTGGSAGCADRGMHFNLAFALLIIADRVHACSPQQTETLRQLITAEREAKFASTFGACVLFGDVHSCQCDGCPPAGERERERERERELSLRSTQPVQ
jgi:hypothetical protein